MKLTPIVAAVLLGFSAPVVAGQNYSASIVETAIGSPDHETLVAAIKAAELVDALSSEGPFTVFAPTDAAFGALPAGTVDTLLMPDNQAQLQAVLTYHVVAGKVSSIDLVKMIQDNGGSVALTTLQGGTLVASLSDSNVILTDQNGGEATVVAVDLDASNGYIHVTDAVSLPS
jgi:uncharacterized surface protein with fasciclin (FAS1) repeats